MSDIQPHRLRYYLMETRRPRRRSSGSYVVLALLFDVGFLLLLIGLGCLLGVRG